MIELAAESGDFGWKGAAEACAEYAFDNDVVTFFSDGLPVLVRISIQYGANR